VVGAVVEGDPDVGRPQRDAAEIDDGPQHGTGAQVLREDPLGVDAVLPADDVSPFGDEPLEVEAISEGRWP